MAWLAHARLPRSHPRRHADGRELISGGATFRVWAPNARAVYVTGDFSARQRGDDCLLTKDAAGQEQGDKHVLDHLRFVREKGLLIFTR